MNGYRDGDDMYYDKDHVSLSGHVPIGGNTSTDPRHD